MKKVKNKYLKTESRGDYKYGVPGPIMATYSDVAHWPFDDSKRIKREIDKADV